MLVWLITELHWEQWARRADVLGREGGADSAPVGRPAIPGRPPRTGHRRGAGWAGVLQRAPM